jgi:DNA-binding response OmpR family regulator
MSEYSNTLLVVEDDPDVAEMIYAYFHIQGYEVYTVDWGEDALQACQDYRPDLVILDIRLPDIDGYEVARRLRANRKTQDVPIIFLTDRRAREDRLLGLSLGADDYVTKPFDVQELRLRVRNAIHRARQGGLLNPVTSLPEGKIVSEKMEALLAEQGWSLLAVHIQNLNQFRERYGFVASDDTLRAVSLMISNSVRDLGNPDDFIGHLSQHILLIATTPDRFPEIKSRILARLEQAVDFFYPLGDQNIDQPRQDRLSFATREVHAHQDTHQSAEQLKLLLAG